jgi:GNAT superfamily N-acetyltransferase
VPAVSFAITAGASPDVVSGLLRGLPEWFGIDAVNREYAAAAQNMPGFVAAARAGEPVGVVLYTRHFADAAEIYLLAVDRGWHRHGVGRALIDACERAVRADGAQLLSVKTLGPSHPDAGYAASRAFYEACGFLRVEELDGVWPGYPCLVMVKPLNER